MASPARSRAQAALLAELQRRGPASAPELCERLGLSQPVFSRLVKGLGESLLRVGRARATRYSARRTLQGVGDRCPVYEVAENGTTRRAAILHAVSPAGFFVESETAEPKGGYYADLPWFLDDQRPAGFLGRRLPRLHPELEAPADVRLWSADHCLRYLARHGWNMPGAFVVGDGAFALFLRYAQAPPETLAASERAAAYPRLAERDLGSDLPGSSAGGEHPKFLAWRDPGAVAVLVKLSPRRRDATSRRMADLLICEHLAHVTLRAHGRQCPRSEIVEADDRVFLEVERFDRLPGGGRRGVVSLMALDAEFLGRLRTWSDSARELAKLGVIPEDTVREVLWLEWFGKLIANSDMHHGNVSFFTRGTTVLGLAPAYDMLPMAYAPAAGDLPERPFEPPLPTADVAPYFGAVVAAAADFWDAVAAERRVADELRLIAASNAERVRALASLGWRLP